MSQFYKIHLAFNRGCFEAIFVKNTLGCLGVNSDVYRSLIDKILADLVVVMAPSTGSPYWFSWGSRLFGRLPAYPDRLLHPIDLHARPIRKYSSIFEVFLKNI
jgi:hypothetical protein